MRIDGESERREGKKRTRFLSPSARYALFPLKELEKYNNLFQYGAVQVKSI